MRIASSMSSYGMTPTTGPKIAPRAVLLPLPTSAFAAAFGYPAMGG
jgi:hypothetical protein